MDTPKAPAFHTKLGANRRVAIPAAMCHDLGLRPGDPVTIEAGAGGIRVVPFDRLIREVQAAFADCRVDGVNASDELVADRRAEAARESAGGGGRGSRAGRP